MGSVHAKERLAGVGMLRAVLKEYDRLTCKSMSARSAHDESRRDRLLGIMAAYTHRYREQDVTVEKARAIVRNPALFHGRTDRLRYNGEPVHVRVKGTRHRQPLTRREFDAVRVRSVVPTAIEGNKRRH